MYKTSIYIYRCLISLKEIESYLSYLSLFFFAIVASSICKFFKNNAISIVWYLRKVFMLLNKMMSLAFYHFHCFIETEL